MNIFVVRADYGKYTDVFRTKEYVAIGWFYEKYNALSTLDEIKTIYRSLFPDDVYMRMNQNSGQIFRFLNIVKKGDIVIIPYADNQLLIGKVRDDDYYFENDTQCPYAYRKKVEWYPNAIDRQQFSIPLQNSLRSSLTCFSISQHNEILHAIGEPLEINAPTPVFDDQSVYNQIKEKLLQLNSDEFEELVSYTLISLGFEAKQSTGKVGDGGIDFEGKLNVMGVASINLQVQVKRYDKSVIGEGEIRNFRGALKKDYQGCFITLSSFNKKAIESANDQNKVQIYLIDGNKFIDIFIEQYEKITDALYEADNDELSNKIKFKKGFIASIAWQTRQCIGSSINPILATFPLGIKGIKKWEIKMHAATQ